MNFKITHMSDILDLIGQLKGDKQKKALSLYVDSLQMRLVGNAPHVKTCEVEIDPDGSTKTYKYLSYNELCQDVRTELQNKYGSGLAEISDKIWVGDDRGGDKHESATRPWKIMAQFEKNNKRYTLPIFALQTEWLKKIGAKFNRKYAGKRIVDGIVKPNSELSMSIKKFKDVQDSDLYDKFEGDDGEGTIETLVAAILWILLDIQSEYKKNWRYVPDTMYLFGACATLEALRGRRSKDNTLWNRKIIDDLNNRVDIEPKLGFVYANTAALHTQMERWLLVAKKYYKEDWKKVYIEAIKQALEAIKLDIFKTGIEADLDPIKKWYGQDLEKACKEVDAIEDDLGGLTQMETKQTIEKEWYLHLNMLLKDQIDKGYENKVISVYNDIVKKGTIPGQEYTSPEAWLDEVIKSETNPKNKAQIESDRSKWLTTISKALETYWGWFRDQFNQITQTELANVRGGKYDIGDALRSLYARSSKQKDKWDRINTAYENKLGENPWNELTKEIDKKLHPEKEQPEPKPQPKPEPKPEPIQKELSPDEKKDLALFADFCKDAIERLKDPSITTKSKLGEVSSKIAEKEKEFRKSISPELSKEFDKLRNTVWDAHYSRVQEFNEEDKAKKLVELEKVKRKFEEFAKEAVKKLDSEKTPIFLQASLTNLESDMELLKEEVAKNSPDPPAMYKYLAGIWRRIYDYYESRLEAVNLEEQYKKTQKQIQELKEKEKNAAEEAKTKKVLDNLFGTKSDVLSKTQEKIHNAEFEITQLAAKIQANKDKAAKEQEDQANLIHKQNMEKQEEIKKKLVKEGEDLENQKKKSAAENLERKRQQELKAKEEENKATEKRIEEEKRRIEQERQDRIREENERQLAENQKQIALLAQKKQQTKQALEEQKRLKEEQERLEREAAELEKKQREQQAADQKKKTLENEEKRKKEEARIAEEKEAERKRQEEEKKKNQDQEKKTQLVNDLIKTMREIELELGNTMKASIRLALDNKLNQLKNSTVYTDQISIFRDWVNKIYNDAAPLRITVEKPEKYRLGNKDDVEKWASKTIELYKFDSLQKVKDLTLNLGGNTPTFGPRVKTKADEIQKDLIGLHEKKIIEEVYPTQIERFRKAQKVIQDIADETKDSKFRAGSNAFNIASRIGFSAAEMEIVKPTKQDKHGTLAVSEYPNIIETISDSVNGTFAGDPGKAVEILEKFMNAHRDHMKFLDVNNDEFVKLKLDLEDVIDRRKRLSRFLVALHWSIVMPRYLAAQYVETDKNGYVTEAIGNKPQNHGDPETNWRAPKEIIGTMIVWAKDFLKLEMGLFMKLIAKECLRDGVSAYSSMDSLDDNKICRWYLYLYRVFHTELLYELTRVGSPDLILTQKLHISQENLGLKAYGTMKWKNDYVVLNWSASLEKIAKLKFIMKEAFEWNEKRKKRIEDLPKYIEEPSEIKNVYVNFYIDVIQRSKK